MNVRRGAATTGAAISVLAATTAIAIAATPNGNFEKGNFQNWNVFDSEGPDAARGFAEGNWRVYTGRLEPSGGEPRGLGAEASLAKPPQGEYAAGVSTTGPGTHILDRVLDANGKSTLSLKLAFKNTADDFYNGGTLSTEPPLRGLGGPDFQNQQLRIDLMEPDAPLQSLDKEDIIKKVFRTKPGDKLKRKWFKVKTGVSSGEFRLRIAEVDNQAPFAVGVDAVKLKQK